MMSFIECFEWKFTKWFEKRLRKQGKCIFPFSTGKLKLERDDRIYLIDLSQPVGNKITTSEPSVPMCQTKWPVPLGSDRDYGDRLVALVKPGFDANIHQFKQFKSRFKDPSFRI